MPQPSSLAVKLVRLRESRGMSGRKFASLCDISREAIRKYESGHSIPSNQTIFKIFSKLDIDVTASEEAKEILGAIYYERINKQAPVERSYGVAANEELRSRISSSTEITEEKVDALLGVIFEQIGDDRRTESLEHYIKTKIKKILENG